MSHLTTIDVKVMNQTLLRRLAMKYGWTITKVPKFVNNYSGEEVENATILSDGTQVKLVLSEDGTPVVDSYFMGKEWERFLQEYSIENLREQACLEGYTFKGVEQKSDGSLIVEIETA